MNHKKAILIIRDGWGLNPRSDEDKYNAINLADAPFCKGIAKSCPHTLIDASGLEVGLPNGIMGNSEVGHQNIGAGRIVDQEIVRIDKGFETKSVLEAKEFQTALEKGKNANLHLLGMTSDAGVHSMLRHLYSILEIAKQEGVKNVFIHAFTDGRDTPPFSGLEFIKQVEQKCEEIGVGKIASVDGRFWSMDRDNRWDRVEKAYNALIGKDGLKAKCATEAVQYYYDNPLDDNRKGDEFILPTMIVDENNEPIGSIKDGDSVIFFNYRGDRPRELTRAFVNEDFSGFARDKKLDIFFATMTEYEVGLCKNIIFKKPEKMKNILGDYISKLGIPQFRCAETEKFAHVTFFFNDYKEEPFNGEDRKLVASPRDVTTYDQKPQMSAPEVAEESAKAILENKYGLVIINFANCDMVGHTGSIEAAKKAVQAVDKGVQEICQAADKAGYNVLITADHGNAEQMWEPSINSPHTRHTLNKVEVILYGKDVENVKMNETGRLADIAPTLLKMMGLKKPEEMTGVSLY